LDYALRRSQHTAEPVTPATTFEYLRQHVPEFSISNDEGVARRRTGVRQAVADLDIWKLCLIGAEQMVPDYQYAAEILIDVFGIARVVDAVVGGRVDYPVQNAEALYQLGMNEKLVRQAGRSCAEHPDRIVAYPDDRQVKQEYAGYDWRPGQSKGGGDHHSFRAVMDAVRGPQQPDAVRTAMFHIKGQVGQQEQCDQARPIMPRHGDCRQSDPIDRRGDDAEDQAMRRCLGQNVPDGDQGRDTGILPRVIAVPSLDHKSLHQDGEEEDRDEHRGDLVWQLIPKIGEAEVKFHLLGPG
jgi:hypothetical protein